MQRTELEGLVSVYENGFEEIEAILDDDLLTATEKLDAISNVVHGAEDEDADDEDEEH